MSCPLWATALLVVLLCVWSSNGSMSHQANAEELQESILEEVLQRQSTANCPQQSPTDLRAYLPCLPSIYRTMPTSPDEECCSKVRGEDLACMCSTFDHYRSAIPDNIVDVNKLMELPKDCGVSIPRGTTCGGVPIPGAN